MKTNDKRPDATTRVGAAAAALVTNTQALGATFAADLVDATDVDSVEGTCAPLCSSCSKNSRATATN